MKNLIQLFTISFSMMLTINAWGYQDTLKVGGYKYLVITNVVSNEWDTKDTVSLLYRIQDDTLTYVLKYYPFQDEGMDCNNLFWSREKLEISDNKFIFTTHYFQQTGIDPIPEWRRQIYEVNEFGQLILVYDKYRYYFQTNWVDH